MAINDPDKPMPVIDNNVRQSWNNYVGWLKKKGMAGSPDLDKNDFGNVMLNQYLRENPDSFLKPEMVKPIQADFANYRQFALDQVKQGKASFAQGTDENNFMTSLSKLDSWPGSETTKHQFPSQYLQHLDEQGKLLSTQNKGFATTNQ